MPKITARAAVVAAVLLLALTGCAGTPESTPSEQEQATTTAAEQTPEATVPATPVEVEPSEQPASSGEAEFVRAGQSFLAAYDINLTDDQVLAAGKYTCEQLGQGAARDQIVALEGATDFINDSFVLDAQNMLCP